MIVQTAMAALDHYVIRPKKHCLLLHKCAAIFYSCNQYNCNITAPAILAKVGLKGTRKQETYLQRFCIAQRSQRHCIKTPQNIKKVYCVADFKDLELSLILSKGEAVRYYDLHLELTEITHVPISRRIIHCSTNTFYFVMLVSMLQQHLEGHDLRDRQLVTMGIMDTDIHRFRKFVKKEWRLLRAACTLKMSWLFVRTSRACSLSTMYNIIYKKLDRILEQRKIIIMCFRKHFDNKSYTKILGEVGETPVFLPRAQPNIIESSPNISIDIPMINTEIMNECASFFIPYTPTFRWGDINLRFKKLIRLLDLTSIKPLLERNTKHMYYLVFHQIISAIEDVPDFNEMNSTLHLNLSVLTLARLDTLIRLTMMKTLVLYCPGILPTNQSKNELLPKMHTFYISVIVGRPYQQLVKLLTTIPEDNLKPLEEPGSSSEEAEGAASFINIPRPFLEHSSNIPQPLPVPLVSLFSSDSSFSSASSCPLVLNLFKIMDYGESSSSSL